MSGIRIGIQGVGVAGGFGAGVAALQRGLSGAGATYQRITLPAEGRSGEAVVSLCDTTRLEEFLPRKALRRIDHFSRLALLGAHLALADSGVAGGDRGDLGIVVASGYGVTRTNFAFLDSFLDDGDPLSSPTLFANSVHNTAAANISIALGLTGPNLTVSQFEMSVFSALLSAARWLEEERVSQVLFGAVDQYCDVLGYCRQRFFGPEGSEPIRPLALERQTAAAGEGAGFFLLSLDPERTAPYGGITMVRTAAARDGLTGLPADAVYFLGANGNAACGSRYARFLPAGRTVAAYAPLFGSLPVGPAFDLAIAALSLREGRLFPSPNPVPGHPWREVTRIEDLGQRGICCLTLGPDAECGAVLLER